MPPLPKGEGMRLSSPFGGKTSPGRGKMSRKRQKGVMASECETERDMQKAEALC